MKAVIDFIVSQKLELKDYYKLIPIIRDKFNITNKNGKEASKECIDLIINWEENVNIVDPLELILNMSFDNLGNKEEKPKVMCFCGSSRFCSDMAVLMWEFEKLGYICMGLHLMPVGYGEAKGHGKVYDHLAELEGVAEHMDQLHLRKIDISDIVYIVNIDGYIGDSTKNEIEYSKNMNKEIRYLEPIN